MKANSNTARRYNEAVNPVIYFTPSDTSDLLNLMWYDKDADIYEPGNSIPFELAAANFCANLTNRPVFWNVGDERGASWRDVVRSKHAFFFAALTWLLKNDVVNFGDEADAEAATVIYLNPGRVDFEDWDATQARQGEPVTMISRAQCLLVNDADEVQLTVSTSAPLTPRYARQVSQLDAANDPEI